MCGPRPLIQIVIPNSCTPNGAREGGPNSAAWGPSVPLGHVPLVHRPLEAEWHVARAELGEAGEEVEKQQRVDRGQHATRLSKGGKRGRSVGMLGTGLERVPLWDGSALVSSSATCVISSLAGRRSIGIIV